MIAEQAQEYQTLSSIDGRSKRMGVDPEAMGHIMSLLANAYSNPRLAVLREYSTNAWDAHVEAGKTDTPIEVTLPNAMSRHLKIRDYGIGLTSDDLCDIYSMYGASTKRNTNEQNGMLGIGCKSGLAYAQQFTIVSVKDHKRTTALVQRTDDGAGEMVIASVIDSTEPEGTEVVIPAPDGTAASEFERLANDFFHVWDEGTVLVNGKPPERIDGLWVTDDLCIVDGENKNAVVMGNVPYPVSRDKMGHELPWTQSLVAFVPIGSVKFAPSREALRDSKNTEKTLDDIKERFRKALIGRVQQEIDAAPNPAEALRTLLQWGPKTPPYASAADYTYKGKPIPKEFDRKGKLLVQTSADSWRLGTHDKDKPLPTSSYPKVVWVQNYSRDSFTAGQKKKLNRYVELARQQFVAKHGNDPYLARQDAAYPFSGIRMYGLYAGTLDHDKYIPADQIIEWADVEEIKLPRTVGAQQGSSGRIPGSYDCWVGTDVTYGVPGDDIDQTKPIFWVQESGAYAGSSARALSGLIGDNNWTLVCLSANRVDKFKRLFPKAQKLSLFAKDEYAKWAKTLTKSDKLALSLRDTGLHTEYDSLDASKVKDPELKRYIKLAKQNVTALQGKQQQFAAFGIMVKESRYSKSQIIPEDHPITKYPLMGEVDLTYGSDKVLRQEHAYIYINAVYAAGRSS